jgi:hypothetical protein
MPLDDVLSYFRSYDKSSFAVYSCQGNEPSEGDILAFETEIGFRLPGEFREFTMSALGGLYMEVRENLWPRPKAYDVGPFWSFLYGLKIFGIASNIPPWLDLRHQYRELRSEGYPGLVPFLQWVGDANRYCFRSDGGIVEWDHEEPDRRDTLDTDFASLVMHEIHKLEDSKERKLRGEDRR